MIQPIQISIRLLSPILQFALCAALPSFCCSAVLLAQETQNRGASNADLSCVKIERVLPPEGIEVPGQDRDRWLAKLDAIDKQCESLQSKNVADVQVLTKACQFAIEFRELYQDKDSAKLNRLIQLAETRLSQLHSGGIDWTKDTRRQVRGFASAVDGSPQPLGLILPEGWATSKLPLPLYVWLHGRGDKATDLHFICERLDKDGEVVPSGAIVVHPFGRQCVGYKSAGETDIMEAIDFVCQHYPVDKERVVLMGFSMGGAGVWHLAAHYADRFVAASPGAGFAETARYQNLKPDQFPPKYEQTLWSVYDVPGYTRNLFNLPMIAYSGENDKQIQAAQVMEEAFAEQGRKLTHLIGPGMGHKYHPDTLKKVLTMLAEAQVAAQRSPPEQLWLQTKHLRYSQRSWFAVDGQKLPYSDTRVDAKRAGNNWSIQTKNVSRLQIDFTKPNSPTGDITLDDQPLELSAPSVGTILKLTRNQGRWAVANVWPTLRKHPGQSGPIDDAFLNPFLVVMPSGQAMHPRVQQWVNCESANFIERWKGLFRGQPRTKLDSQVTVEDMQQYHLILWGDAQSNVVIKQVLAQKGNAEFAWSKDRLQMGNNKFDSASHVPLMIYPNPLAPDHYIVINSGPTFRQAHDRTNSLQNPHLPDWAIVSLDEPPSATSPGRIAKCGFFDDAWRLDNNQTW